MTSERRAGLNTVAQAVAVASWLLASLFLTPYLYGALGSSLFGAWALLASLGPMVLLLDLGLGTSLVREVAGGKATGRLDRARDALGLGLLACLALGLLLAGGAWLGGGALDEVLGLGLGADLRTALLLTAVAAGMTALSLPFGAVLDGNLRMDLTAAATLAGSAAYAAVTLALVPAGLGLLAPALGMVASSTLRSAVVAAIAVACFPEFRPRFLAASPGLLRELCGFGARIQATNVATFVNLGADRWILGAVYSPATVAPYEVAAKLLAWVGLLPRLALAALFPAAAAAHETRDRFWLDRFYLRGTRYLALGAALATAVLTSGAAAVVTAWMGEPLDFARDAIWLLAPAVGLQVCTGAAVIVVRAEGQPGHETRFSVLSLVLNLSFTLPLLIVAGPAGVLVGSAVAMGTSCGWFFWRFHRSTGRPARPVLGLLAKPWLAAAVAAACGLAATLPLDPPHDRPGAALALAASTAAAVVSYLGALSAMRFWDGTERALAVRLFARRRAGATPPRPGWGVHAAERGRAP